MLRYEHGGDIYQTTNIRLDFSVNINPLGMPSIVKRVLAENIGEYERYPDPYCRALTMKIAQQYGVEQDMALCGNGASDLIFRICACIRPSRALMLAPTFSEYERSVTAFGGEISEHNLTEENGFALTERILSDITPNIRMLFLCNPNNPTGRLIDPRLLRRIADKCEKSGVYLVLDECFLEFTNGESMVPFLRKYPHLLILNAFTKLYAMAGLRLGYLLCEDVALVKRIAAFGPQWSVSVPAQKAGLAALGVSGWPETTRALIETERRFMEKQLTALGLTVFPGEGNFLLVKCDTPLYEPLAKRGILVRSCTNFTGLNERFIRIGLKKRKQNAALVAAIAEVLHG